MADTFLKLERIYGDLMRSGVDELGAVSSVRAVQSGARGSLALGEQWNPNRGWQSERMRTLSVNSNPVMIPPSTSGATHRLAWMHRGSPMGGLDFGGPAVVGSDAL
jgi:hypothetical protein